MVGSSRSADSDEFEAYNQWLHYAEGSAMLPLMLRLYVGRLGEEAGAPLKPRIDSEIANHLGYVDQALKGREWLVGNALTGADIQMSFVGEAARGARAAYPNMNAWVEALSGAARLPTRAGSAADPTHSRA